MNDKATGGSRAAETGQSMEALTALLTRASAGRLTDPAPDEDQLRLILSAAANAPDHGRLRPWRFLVVRGSARAQLGQAFADALARRTPESSAQMLEAERKKAERAPLIIVVSAEVQPNPKVPEVEQIVAVGAAAQNILLAAHALGFGAFWRTGAAAYDDFVKERLSIPAAESIVGFIYVGTLGAPLPERKPAESLPVRYL
jgi:nitroreductase